jgi:hypothetical protein
MDLHVEGNACETPETLISKKLKHNEVVFFFFFIVNFGLLIDGFSIIR